MENGIYTNFDIMQRFCFKKWSNIMKAEKFKLSEMNTLINSLYLLETKATSIFTS